MWHLLGEGSEHDGVNSIVCSGVKSEGCHDDLPGDS
jgi:hypothetical protein